MNMIEAKKELKKIAKGKSHSITFTITEASDGVARKTCCVYLEKHGHHKSQNFKGAIESLKVGLANYQRALRASQYFYQESHATLRPAK